MTIPADPRSGYFGPGSVTWRVMADPAAGVGGLAALFVQALHPRAMAGVDQHSDFHTAFWPRLGRTAEYVMTVTYSPRDRVDAIRIHQRNVGAFAGCVMLENDPAPVRGPSWRDSVAT